jgi:hypothetical protein
MARLRGLPGRLEYPVEGRSGVIIGFESHQTVDRDATGDFWSHWR